MTINELFEKYKEMPSAKRRLLLITPAATVLLYAFMTAPSNPHNVPLLSANGPADCVATKLRMSVLGRSLVSYDWQSGNCSGAPAKTRVNP